MQVEEFACDIVLEAGRNQRKVEMFELKITGGGKGCDLERSRNMNHWWIDLIKRWNPSIPSTFSAVTLSAPVT